jgi:uncharacterized membrane protein
VSTISPVEAVHLATVAPAAAIGFVLLGMRKGTPLHRGLGRAYLTLMFFTAAASLFIPAAVPPRFGHFGVIHLLSLLTLVTVPLAWWAARTGRIASHRGMMIGLFIGAILIAGGLTLVPGRFLGNLVWG